MLAPGFWANMNGIKWLVCKNRACLKPEAFGILSSWKFSLSKLWVAKERKEKEGTESD